MGLVEEVEVEDDIDIEVGRDGRGFEGGAEDFMDVEEDVSRNSGGGIWISVVNIEYTGRCTFGVA